ncbi:MAG: ImmA/IrrE family metallo-endopeptidase [Vulcanimicrobiota bacterium]
MRVGLLAALILLAPAWGQDFPVEVEMLGPARPLARPLARSLRWQPPPVQCRLCGETTTPGLCSCHFRVDQEFGERLLAQVRQDAQELDPRLVYRGGLEVRVVSQARLDELGGEPVYGLYEEGRIWLSQALTRREAYAVLAHEFGHAWHFQENPAFASQPERLREGFADWVALQLVQARPDPSARVRLLEQRQEPYRSGLATMLRLEEQGGREAVLARVAPRY